MSWRRLLAPMALLALVACGKADNDPGPGGVTVGEAKALDDAAEMLEQRRMPADAVVQPSARPAESAPKQP